MAIARQTDAQLVRPIIEQGAVVKRGVLGATTVAGEQVALQADGKWDPAIGTSVNLHVGVAVQGGGDGDSVDIVRFGPVTSITGGTPGAAVYVADTAGGGEPSETKGTKGTIVGFVEDATTLFVQPQVIDFV